MNAMEQAFSKAGVPAAALVADLDDTAISDLMGKGEITMVDGRYVHACPLPTGWLEQMQTLKDLRHQRVTSNVKMVAKEQMAAEGYTDAREYSVAQMREQARWINGDDHPLPRILTDTVTDLEAPKVRQLRRKRRYFDPSDIDTDPLELLTPDDRQRIMDQARLAVRVLEGTADWDAALQIVPCKMVDSIFLYGSERILHQIEQQAKAVTDQIATVRRNSTMEELANTQIERLEQKKVALRVQYRHMQLLLKGFELERDNVVGRAGIDWPAYESLKKRAARGVAAMDKKRRAWRSKAHLETLAAMTPQQRHQWMEQAARYDVRHNGVDADPDAAAAPAAHDESPEGEE